MEQGVRFVDVAVNSGQPVRRAFTYRVPEGMEVSLGMAVFVAFGTRILHGIVTAEAEPPTEFEARDIDAIADPAPVLDDEHLALSYWLSTSYLAPLWDCIAASLPSGYGQKHMTMVAPVEIPPLLPVYPQDQRVLEFLAAHGRVTVEQLRAGAGPITTARLQRLQEGGHLTVAQGLAPPAGHHRLERMVELSITDQEALDRAEALIKNRPRSVEARLLRALAQSQTIRLLEARETGATRTLLDRLAGEGTIRETARTVDRNPLAGREFERQRLPTLTGDQQTVADQIAGGRGEYLIHGATGSGKTEVYLDLVGRALAAGKGAIILVPEISLTPQAIRRYGERFGDTLAVFHSELGIGELYDQWFHVRNGDARVVVGSRSALFAPVPRLGLVVVDEEHEWSYKQENPPPRYHAREAARELCRLSDATLLLGSATPDIVTYHRTESGEATRLELTQRVDPSSEVYDPAPAMPSINVVDMREELKAGNRGMFSYPLLRSVSSALRAREQSLLFVNRRGGARFLLCRDCGLVATCSNCQSSMSLDSSREFAPKVICHHCGRSYPLEERCPRCESGRYRPFGVGTQRVEQEASKMFPGARVVRWDSDTTSVKGSHDRIVSALEAGEIDIVVGTQVLAKGLDLPEMTVVGIIDADIGLNLPNYAAHERAFQLISQVAGRAGRRGRRGEVYVQTYDPTNAAVRRAADYDYRAFYDYEIAHRRRAAYPPFARLAVLQFRHRNQEAGVEEASRLATELRVKRDAAGRAGPEVLGPTPAYIPRVRGYYRWQILIRGHDPANLLGNVRFGLGWSIDIDPAGTLS
ncbi:MAG TPA: primosomal protein N' [Dehalococcoidia bacterium]|nr:primosomal protein N' [Dehalococcoidia bacterium]